MAALWKLPIIYVCENNHYSEYTVTTEVNAGELKARPQAFGIPVEEVDGQDVRQVYTTAMRLVSAARRGEGPSFLICDTYRYYGHHVGDVNRTYYRPKEEEIAWHTDHDPIQLLAGWLVSAHSIQESFLNDIEQKVIAEIAVGVDFAEKAPFPTKDEVNQDVYA